MAGKGKPAPRKKAKLPFPGAAPPFVKGGKKKPAPKKPGK